MLFSYSFLFLASVVAVVVDVSSGDDDDGGEGGTLGVWVVVALVVLAGIFFCAWYWRERVPSIDDLLPK